MLSVISLLYEDIQIFILGSSALDAAPKFMFPCFSNALRKHLQIIKVEVIFIFQFMSNQKEDGDDKIIENILCRSIKSI